MEEKVKGLSKIGANLVFAPLGGWQSIFSAVSAAILRRQNDHQVARRKVTLQLFRHSRKVVLIRKRPRPRNDKDGQMAFARLYGQRQEIVPIGILIIRSLQAIALFCPEDFQRSLRMLAGVHVDPAAQLPCQLGDVGGPFREAWFVFRIVRNKELQMANRVG